MIRLCIFTSRTVRWPNSSLFIMTVNPLNIKVVFDNLTVPRYDFVLTDECPINVSDFKGTFTGCSLTAKLALPVICINAVASIPLHIQRLVPVSSFASLRDRPNLHREITAAICAGRNSRGRSRRNRNRFQSVPVPVPVEARFINKPLYSLFIAHIEPRSVPIRAASFNSDLLTSDNDCPLLVSRARAGINS